MPHLACRAAVLQTDLVPLLEVEKTASVAGDLHARPPPLTASHLWPVVHLDREAHLARLLQIAHLDEVSSTWIGCSEAPGQRPGRGQGWELPPLLQGREGSWTLRQAFEPT